MSAKFKDRSAALPLDGNRTVVSETWSRPFLHSLSKGNETSRNQTPMQTLTILLAGRSYIVRASLLREWLAWQAGGRCGSELAAARLQWDEHKKRKHTK